MMTGGTLCLVVGRLYSGSSSFFAHFYPRRVGRIVLFSSRIVLFSSRIDCSDGRIDCTLCQQFRFVQKSIV